MKIVIGILGDIAIFLEILFLSVVGAGMVVFFIVFVIEMLCWDISMEIYVGIFVISAIINFCIIWRWGVYCEKNEKKDV
jgi:hypothetical protein